MAIPPLGFFLNSILGGFLFILIPNPSNSFSITDLCLIGRVASRIIIRRLQVLATAITYLPLPLPSLAPSIIPGKSSNYIFVPLCIIFPGIHVKVVNSYAATLDIVPVNFVNNVDFPTEGNPIIPTLASPVLETSNPSPVPPLLPLAPSISSRFNFASFALSVPI